MTTGYSGKPLAEKLGIKSGFLCHVENAPSNYQQLLHPLPVDVQFHHSAPGKYDFVHFFTTQKSQLEQQLPHLKQMLKPAGMLWISWPKGAAKVETDLNENIVQQLGLAAGLVDVKVAAIDEVWSGLKFVYRLKNRPTS